MKSSDATRNASSIAVAILGTLALVIASAASAGEAAARPPAGWSERGVFGFRDVGLDFQRQIERFAGTSTPLTDCSDAGAYCARGAIVNIVLPRYCSGLEGAAGWSRANVRTDVLWSGDELQPVERYGSGRLLLLGNAQQPEIVYEYDPEFGVRGFFYDPTGRTDFVAMARRGEIGAYGKRLATEANPPRTYFGLATLDPFGKCLL